MHNLFHLMQSIDIELNHYIALFGKQIYVILFILVFAKTAFVVLTFLPGDAILFASGTIAATGHLNFPFLLILFIIATVAGDAQNYFIGKMLGSSTNKTNKFSLLNYISKNSIEKTNKFLINYGKFAIMFSRFLPLLNTTLPFISGFTAYSFKRFITLNIVGAIFWTLIWVGAGYILGNLTWVEAHLFISLLIITIFSFIPPIIMFGIEYSKRKAAISEVF